jgi:hypothetical protein
VVEISYARTGSNRTTHMEIPKGGTTAQPLRPRLPGAIIPFVHLSAATPVAWPPQPSHPTLADPT